MIPRQCGRVPVILSPELEIRHGGFTNAATPRGVLGTAGRLSEQGRQRLQDAVEKNHASHKTLILEEGLTWLPMGINHEDAQLIESRAFGVQEVARIFNVPAHLTNADVKTSMTYANAETRALDFLKFTSAPGSRGSSPP